jgi:hypothetical protein
MTIYEEFIKRVQEGESFDINFANRSLKVGKKFLIKDGCYDEKRELFDGSDLTMYDILDLIEMRYNSYKYSLPSERSDNKRRGYFKALSVNNLTDAQMATGEMREVARAHLEGFILCMIIEERFVWDENKLGKWFYQSKNDPDLVILRSWIENN